MHGATIKIKIKNNKKRGTGCLPITSVFTPVSVISPIFLTHIRLNAAVTRTQADETWEPSNIVMFFRT